MLANRLRTGRTCSRQLGSCTFADQLLYQCPRSRRPASLLEASMGSPRSDIQHGTIMIKCSKILKDRSVGKECEVIRQSDAKCKSAGIWDVFFLKGTAPSASRSSKRSLSGTRTMWLQDKSGVTPVSQSATIHTSASSCKWISPSIITTYIVKQAVMWVLYGWFM